MIIDSWQINQSQPNVFFSSLFLSHVSQPSVSNV